MNLVAINRRPAINLARAQPGLMKLASRCHRFAPLEIPSSGERKDGGKTYAERKLLCLMAVRAPNNVTGAHPSTLFHPARVRRARVRDRRIERGRVGSDPSIPVTQ